MKKYLYILLIVPIFTMAQVGINTTTPAAQLDIKSSNQATPANTDGLLIPKVDAFPVINPTAAQKGMLVYLTTTSGANPPGFYYWNNPGWVGIAYDSSSWKLTGNAGTNPVTNFIGTTDNQDLVFKRFALRSGVLGTTNTSFGLNALNPSTTGTENTAIGVSALASNTLGSLNTATGLNSLMSNTTGFANTANGRNALRTNTIGTSNTAIGHGVLTGNNVGSDNTAIGSDALFLNTSGSFNTAVGRQALTGNITGTANTTLGYGADVATSNLTNATAIGANAEVNASNSLVLGSITGVNGATSNVNVGIGTTSPADRLHVVGNIRMVDGNQAAGKVLTSDVNGTATWQNVSANAWGITGNSAITDATNFIGTTNFAADVVFKRGGIEAGRLDASNTSFGVSSLVSNTTGFSNSAFGIVSLYVNTTGILNSAFGTSSLESNTIGSNNSAFGVNALKSNDSGDNNVGIGRSALEGSISGSQNIAIGTNSLFANTTGDSNIAVGYQSLRANTTGQTNVAIGLSSLRTNTTGIKNTSIGANSDVTTASLVNATAIGANAEVGASNSLVLGSINGVNGAVASTKVGIGTTTPLRALHLSTGSSGGTPNPNADFVLESNGAIYQHFLVPSANETGILFGSDVSAIRGGVLYNNSTDLLQFRSGGNTNRMIITAAGDVGIGTVAPGGQFELSLNEGRKPASNTWTITSDARLKNVNGIYEKGLDEIIQLKPIRYHYKNTDKKTFDQKVLDKEAFGFLAQEVQPLFPEAVGTDTDGYLNFDLHPILIASVNALKELNAKNVVLEQENENLKLSVQQLNEKVTLIMAEVEKLKR